MQYTIKRVENKQYIEIKDLQNIIHKRLMTLIYKEQLQTAKKRANNNRKNIKQDIVYILSNSNRKCIWEKTNQNIYLSYKKSSTLKEYIITFRTQCPK